MHYLKKCTSDKSLIVWTEIGIDTGFESENAECVTWSRRPWKNCNNWSSTNWVCGFFTPAISSAIQTLSEKWKLTRFLYSSLQLATQHANGNWELVRADVAEYSLPWETLIQDCCACTPGSFVRIWGVRAHRIPVGLGVISLFGRSEGSEWDEADFVEGARKAAHVSQVQQRWRLALLLC